MKLTEKEVSDMYSQAAFQRLVTKMEDQFGVGVWFGRKGLGKIEVTENQVLEACFSVVHFKTRTNEVEVAVLRKLTFDFDPEQPSYTDRLSFSKIVRAGACLLTFE